ncbi:MAG: pantetheine-phosphate adenylyltransferase [Magnetococcales bacterium]|nr:pantetheine-phosphate adenylyltransferase [Magnetococcales bacterium]MBF0323017.1 pantetheine-phosphate adenylyltransferase [Magnetococcales bacterium]
MKRIAVYPGTFDPVTLGHVDVITRGAALFDRLIVAVASNHSKKTLFTGEERMAQIRDSIRHLPHVEVCRMQGLLVEYANRIGAGVILRGLRAVSDFEYEFQMASMNRKLAGDVETVFLMAGESTIFISSRLVKEIAVMGGDVRPFVPAHVVPELMARLKALQPDGPQT